MPYKIKLRFLKKDAVFFNFGVGGGSDPYQGVGGTPDPGIFEGEGEVAEMWLICGKYVANCMTRAR